jgi:hypothetical protein
MVLGAWEIIDAFWVDFPMGLSTRFYVWLLRSTPDLAFCLVGSRLSTGILLHSIDTNTSTLSLFIMTSYDPFAIVDFVKLDMRIIHEAKT